MSLLLLFSGKGQPGGTFGLNAVIVKTQVPAGGFTANAIVRKTQTPTGFPVSAIKRQTFTPSGLTLDAIKGKTQVPSGGFKVDYAWITGGSGFFSVDAAKRQNIGPVGFGLDAVIRKTWEPTFAANAVVWKQTATGFAADAVKAQTFTPTGIAVDALKGKLTETGFPLDAAKFATVTPTAPPLTLDAWLMGGTTFSLSAVIADYRRRGRFDLFALISRNFFGLDAVIMPVFAIDAVLRKVQDGSFGVSAWIQAIPGTQYGSGTADAVIGKPASGSFGVNAYIVGEPPVPPATVTGSATLDAWVLGAMGTFGLDAVIVGPTRTGSFTLSADIAKAGERRGSFGVDATAGRTTRGLFTLSAWTQRGVNLNAFIQPYFRLDAYIMAPVVSGFTLRAWIFQTIALNAVKRQTFSGGFGLNAVIADANGAWPGHQGWVGLDAVIAQPAKGGIFYVAANIRIPQGFALDAYIGHNFTLGAWIATAQGGMGGFSVGAYIQGLDLIIWPPDGGPAEDANGDPLPSWFKANRKFRVNITVGGTDVTGDVIWAQTEFAQMARTGPGTFTITLKGAHEFWGGEEVLLSLDDRREFGGYVLQVEQGYIFDAADKPKTVLHGADFNILFDKLMVYNKAVADPWPRQGGYRNWKSFPEDTMDKVIITKVCRDYIQLPPDLDYTTYVDEIDTPNPETPWILPEAGSPWRLTMQSISQITNAVFWIDAYKFLHYHDRSTVNAPAPITDGLGGVSSRELSLTTDASQLITDDWLWGTLARTVEGEIMYTHHYGDIGNLGLWQYGEWRSELHHARWLSKRAGSIISRYGQPIHRAEATVFEPGYMAGQVVNVVLSQQGVSENLVIRENRITFAVGRPPEGSVYYGVPRYDLTIGLDPETPWNIYDYLPFEFPGGSGGTSTDPNSTTGWEKYHPTAGLVQGEASPAVYDWWTFYDDFFVRGYDEGMVYEGYDESWSTPWPERQFFYWDGSYPYAQRVNGQSGPTDDTWHHFYQPYPLGYIGGTDLVTALYENSRYMGYGAVKPDGPYAGYSIGTDGGEDWPWQRVNGLGYATAYRAYSVEGAESFKWRTDLIFNSESLGVGRTPPMVDIKYAFDTDLPPYFGQVGFAPNWYLGYAPPRPWEWGHVAATVQPENITITYVHSYPADYAVYHLPPLNDPVEFTVAIPAGATKIWVWAWWANNTRPLWDYVSADVGDDPYYGGGWAGGTIMSLMQSDRDLVPGYWGDPRYGWKGFEVSVTWKGYYDENGDIAGVVTEGWGCEIIPVGTGGFVLSAVPWRGTLNVYDGADGKALHEGQDWEYDHSHDDGRHYKLMGSASPTTLLCCYLNMLPTPTFKPTTPRVVQGSTDRRGLPGQKGVG